MAVGISQVVNAVMDSDAGAAQDQPITWGATGSCGVVFVAGWISGGTVSYPADGCVGSVSGAWTRGPVLARDASNRAICMYYKPNVTAGAETITVTPAASLTNGRIVLLEATGVATVVPLEDSQTEDSTASAGHDLTLTPTTANSLCIYAIHILGDTTISGDLTQRSEVETFMACQVMTVTGTGATVGSWSLGASIGAMLIGMTLRPEPDSSSSSSCRSSSSSSCSSSSSSSCRSSSSSSSSRSSSSSSSSSQQSSSSSSSSSSCRSSSSSSCSSSSSSCRSSSSSSSSSSVSSSSSSRSSSSSSLSSSSSRSSSSSSSRSSSADNGGINYTASVITSRHGLGYGRRRLVFNE